jgi:hypothetical protein
MQLLPPRLIGQISIAYWTILVSLGTVLLLLSPSPIKYTGMTGVGDEDQLGGYNPPRMVKRSEPKIDENPSEESSPKEEAEATQVAAETEETSNTSSEIQSVSLDRKENSDNPSSAQATDTAQFTENENNIDAKSSDDSPVAQTNEDIGATNLPTQVAQRIIIGVNAPGYRLKDREMIDYLVTNHSARFVLIDESQIAFDLGKSLEKPLPRRINGDAWWKANYAERMLGIPITKAGASFARISDVFAFRKIPFKPNACQLFLAIPHGLDREIYRSQLDFMGADFRTDVFTVISVDEFGVIVHSIEES